MTPLKGWETGKIIGGIESITYNGKRFYFCASGDYVVSPLTSEINEIVSFAEHFMEKTTGKVSREHWIKEAHWSIDGSELASGVGERDFNSNTLNKLKNIIINAKTTNETNKSADLPYHLLWLIAASIEWEKINIDKDIIDIGKKLGFEQVQEDWFEAIELTVDIISEKKKNTHNTSIREVSLLLEACFNGIHSKQEKSWKLLLSDLVGI